MLDDAESWEMPHDADLDRCLWVYDTDPGGQMRDMILTTGPRTIYHFELDSDFLGLGKGTKICLEEELGVGVDLPDGPLDLHEIALHGPDSG